MANQRQRIRIGESEQQIERVVRRRRAMIPLGIETGYVEHRHSAIPVWRPINMFALGLDCGWRENMWRSIHRWNLAVGPDGPEVEGGLSEHNIAGTTVSLPGINVDISPALRRFLSQHLQ
ncbi:hypothetical protein [Sphingomonas sanxanigenens]|uniref:hypothetical protein n=1 Tax=Sphingomonas sanxanigenens TaxID=397260 RepID=UPI00138F1EBA|nr:hypothetical protein [Sphingomonas sanxanigenens]